LPSDFMRGSETRGRRAARKGGGQQRKELCCHMGVPTSIMYTFFMILHLSLILTFINYCQLFMMVVDLVMVFLYVSVLCSGYVFQHVGGT